MSVHDAPVSERARPRTAVIVGASGHVGNAIARELVERGWTVTVASRSPHGAANLQGLPVRVVAGDADDDGQVAAWTSGQDLLVDAATPYPLRLAASHRRAAEHAARRAGAFTEAARRHGATLAHVSSFTTVPAARDALAAIEAGVTRRLHPYFAVKESAEAVVMEASAAGLPVVVVNPTLCVGPWDGKPRALCWMPQVVRGELPAALQHVVNVVDVRDVARVLVEAVDAKRGERIVVSGHDITFPALCRWIAESAGVKAPQPVLSPVGVASAVLGEAALALGGVESPFPALGAMLMAQHVERAPARAQRALGVVPRPLSSTLADSLAWYRKIGYC